MQSECECSTKYSKNVTAQEWAPSLDFTGRIGSCLLDAFSDRVFQGLIIKFIDFEIHHRGDEGADCIT